MVKKRKARAFLFSIIGFGLAAAGLAAAGGSVRAEPVPPFFTAGEPVEPGLSRPMRSILTAPESGQGEVIPVRNPSTGMDSTVGRASPEREYAASRAAGGESPELLLDFEGLSGTGFAPPDPAGDVGPDHYVQMVNVSFAVFDKSGGLVAGPTPFHALFSGFGEYCQDGFEDGAPTVVYDSLAGRWVLSKYSWSDLSLNILCVAVSITADPTGQYHLYEFTLPDFSEYPKIGVWTDAYYVGTNTGLPNFFYAHALDRAKMLAGQPASVQSSGGHPNYLMPADFDGLNAPPGNSPGIFYTVLKSGYPNHPPGVDRIQVYEFDVDWDTPANSTFLAVDMIPIGGFNYTVCGAADLNCIPQPVTSMELDAFSEWPAWRLAYRNLNDYEALVGNFTVDLNGSDLAAIRWFELRNTVSGWELHQEGNYAPDGDHRFMGSIAMDGSGNIALGYSVSSLATKPSVRYATRLVTDPPGTLQAEQSLVAGGGVQTGFPYWGRSSALTVDPADECTFWLTGEYHDVDDTGFNWNTRIGAFKIPTCSGGFEPDFTIDAAPDNLEVCSPDDAVFTVTVGSILGYSDPVALSVQGAPAGTSTGFSANPVTPPNTSLLTIANTGAASPGNYPIEVTGTGSSTTYSSTVTLNLFTPVGGAPALISPANGANGVSVNPTLTWNAVSQAESYLLQIALNPGFSNIVYSAPGLAITSHVPDLTLDEATTHYWRVRASNACGNGSFSGGFSFTTADLPPILLVDDDDNNPDVRSAWTGALSGLGLAFDVKETGSNDDESRLDNPANYETVIWFTGARFGAVGAGPAGPSPATEAALADWLDAGGCFFISSQDYHADKGTTGFMTGYLGVQDVGDEMGDYTSVSGENLLAGLGPYVLTFPYNDFTDLLVPGNGGQAVMLGTNGHVAGVAVEDGFYKTMYWGFGLETLPSGGRSAVLDSFLDWCEGSLPPGHFIYLPVTLKDP